MNPISDFPPHSRCFACGRLNSDGLGLVFEVEPGAVSCVTTVASRFQSYDGVIHGGILAAIADAAMVHLIHREYGGRPFTCRLEVRYRAPVLAGVQVGAKATIISRRHGVVRASCRVTMEGRLCVEATASFRVRSNHD